MHRAVASEIATLERHLARAARRGLRGLGTITPLTQAQSNQASALGLIAWALVDAEQRGDRLGAASVVPVFIASWNAWVGAERVWSPSAPGSLNLSSWGADHDRALKYALGTFAVASTGQDDPITTAVLDALDRMPGGAPFSAPRGVWFGTTTAFDRLRTVGHVGQWVTQALATFRSGGAAGLSTFTDSIAQGADPTASVPRTTPPPVPAVSTPHASNSGGTVVLPETTITAHSSRPSSPTWYWYALGGAAAIGVGVFAWQKIAGAS